MALALFDFDGTITHTDSFEPFVRFAASRVRLSLGSLVLAPTIARYRLGWLSAPSVRERVVYFGFRGRRSEEVERQARRFASEVLPGMLKRSALERIEWHQKRGDAVAVVSASLVDYLSPFCRERGLDLIANRLEASRGVLTGRYLGRDVCGPEKARRVSERYDLESAEQVYAYGDTDDDRELLALATHPHHRFRPGPAPRSRPQRERARTGAASAAPRERDEPTGIRPL